MKRAEFYLVKYLPVLLVILGLLPRIFFNELPTGEVMLMRTRVMCVLALIAIVGVIVSGNLRKSRLSQSFFIIWSSLEAITFLDFSFYAAKITLFSAPVYFLLITIIGRYFLNEKGKNTLHFYGAIWALVILASSQFLYFAREQYAATPAPMEVEMVNVWIALFL